MKRVRAITGSLLTMASLCLAHPSYADWIFLESGWQSTPSMTLEPANDTEAREAGWSFTPTPRVWASTSHSTGVASINATYVSRWYWDGNPPRKIIKISRSGSVSGNVTGQGIASSTSLFGGSVSGSIPLGSQYSASGSHGPLTFYPADSQAQGTLILEASAQKATAYALASGEITSEIANPPVDPPPP